MLKTARLEGMNSRQTAVLCGCCCVDGSSTGGGRAITSFFLGGMVHRSVIKSSAGYFLTLIIWGTIGGSLMRLLLF